MSECLLVRLQRRRALKFDGFVFCAGCYGYVVRVVCHTFGLYLSVSLIFLFTFSSR
jgi:hypothetical protein